jgi:hypothetical protein
LIAQQPSRVFIDHIAAECKSEKDHTNLRGSGIALDVEQASMVEKFKDTVREYQRLHTSH